MDQGFPGQHTTATSVTVGTTAVNPTLRFDRSYIQTIPGMLKVGQVILNLLGFICVVSVGYDITSSGKWFNFFAMFGFWVSGILLSFYLFHIIEKFHKIPWIKFELFYCGILACCDVIASAFMASLAGHYGALGAAAFFGFTVTVLYAGDAWIKWLAFQRGELAQGERQPNKTVSSLERPAY